MRSWLTAIILVWDIARNPWIAAVTVILASGSKRRRIQRTGYTMNRPEVAGWGWGDFVGGSQVAW